MGIQQIQIFLCIFNKLKCFHTGEEVAGNSFSLWNDLPLLSGLRPGGCHFFPLRPEEQPGGSGLCSVSSGVSKQQTAGDRGPAPQQQGSGRHARCHSDQAPEITHHPQARWGLPSEFVVCARLFSLLCITSKNTNFCVPFPRWCEALHSEGASGRGLPCGSLLPHGSLLLHEWRPLPPEDAGQGAGRGHEPHHQQPPHGLRGFCGQAAVALHVHLPQRGSEEPLLQVGGGNTIMWAIM